MVMQKDERMKDEARGQRSHYRNRILIARKLRPRAAVTWSGSKECTVDGFYCQRCLFFNFCRIFYDNVADLRSTLEIL